MTAKIIHIDKASRRLGLSIRQLTPAEVEMTADEWHAEQDTLSEASPSAFSALSSLADALVIFVEVISVTEEVTVEESVLTNEVDIITTDTRIVSVNHVPVEVLGRR